MVPSNPSIWLKLVGVAVVSAILQSCCPGGVSFASIGLSISPESASENDIVFNMMAPSGIQDARLIEGWNNLYSQVDPIRLPDGSTLTGRSLAQFIQEQEISVVWDTEKQCHGMSCSLHYCYEEYCTYDDPNHGVTPIYINPDSCRDLQSLVRTLAHEIYHRTEPFGNVKVTLFEEFNAYQVGARLSGSNWPNFDWIDPLVPGQLEGWYKEYQLQSYSSLSLYSARVAEYVEKREQNSDLPDWFSDQVASQVGLPSR